MTIDTSARSHSAVYGWYVVAVLMFCQTLASLDAKLPFILVESIKHDLSLSDTQIGLITGPAFSLTYAIAAIPIAKFSDRGVRVHIISGAIVLWSALTALGGFALGIMTLVLSRTGVAIGEAALLPASHSIIADYTDKASRPKAIAIYSLGLAIGAFLALSLGGYLNDRFGWRATLFIIGASGLAISLLVFITVREPKRDWTTGARESPKGDILSLFRNKPVRNLILGGTLVGIGAGALSGWAPAYIMRTFHLTATETGATYGAIAGAVGVIGILCGGFVAGWFAQRAPRNTFYLLAICLLVAMVAQMGSLLTGSYGLFIVLSAVSTLLLASYIAPTYATVQTLVDPGARSFAAAVTLFSINGVGFAAGAFFCGWLSDLLRPHYGTNSLKIALLILSVFLFWSAVHYILVGRHLPDTVEQSRRDGCRYV
ncbi:spinster family MFS transporter [Rhizorhabdus dicambivorans]|uniref:MFS transporter n=1 Tax=Rhizorhabdus dicambivorans TaxID=1850238 RepID=A0A2A4G025_9SPHN|nr:MFS transporter [Rhizorhabdus dicambivorans]ATE65134.1 MFS transporter [Rhizorhabdus dicambivorans]PCE44407.1 MFS transporter [Rhizorhabdus dicambivorans]